MALPFEIALAYLSSLTIVRLTKEGSQHPSIPGASGLQGKVDLSTGAGHLTTVAFKDRQY
jgi:hypothetical protein